MFKYRRCSLEMALDEFRGSRSSCCLICSVWLVVACAGLGGLSSLYSDATRSWFRISMLSNGVPSRVILRSSGWKGDVFRSGFARCIVSTLFTFRMPMSD